MNAGEDSSDRTAAPTGASPVWWRERDDGLGVAHSYRMTRVHRERSAWQEIEVWEHPEMGRVLVLDGLVQTAQADEFVYHEMAAHVALCARTGPASVLVVGGGDGGVLREVLRHDRVTAVDVVEIDARVIAVSNRYLGIQGDYDDPRVSLHVTDAADFLARAPRERRWDVVVLDLTEPVGPSRRLFSPAFCAALAAHLADGGVVVDSDSIVLTRRGPRFLQELCAGGAPNLVRLVHRHRALAHVAAYHTVVPSYPGGVFGFFLYSRDGHDYSVPATGMTGRHYNAAVHRASFALPAWWDDALTGGER